MTENAFVRPVVKEDLPTCLGMIARFVEESDLPFTFDEKKSVETLCTHLHNPNSIMLVEEYEGAITGGVIGIVERDYCVESSAYVIKLYIEKEFRGLGTARALVAAFELEARKLGASIVFAAATAGMGERVEKLFVKLFERFGYKFLGRTLMKEIGNG